MSPSLAIDLPDHLFQQKQEVPLVPTFREIYELPVWAREWTIRQVTEHRLVHGATLEQLLEEAAFDQWAQAMVLDAWANSPSSDERRGYTA